MANNSNETPKGRGRPTKKRGFNFGKPKKLDFTPVIPDDSAKSDKTLEDIVEHVEESDNRCVYDDEYYNHLYKEYEASGDEYYNDLYKEYKASELNNNLSATDQCITENSGTNSPEDVEACSLSIAVTRNRRSSNRGNSAASSSSLGDCIQEQQHQCEVCQRIYSRSDTLIAHVRAVHGKTDVKCGYCDKQFTTQQALERHWPTHHRVKCFECPHCPNKFTRDDTLSLHIQRVHESSADADSSCRQCKECGKVLGCVKSLRRHERTVHGDVAPFQCDICKCSFKRRDALKQHEGSHYKNTMEHWKFYL